MKIANKELKMELYVENDLFYVKGSIHRLKIPNLDKNLALFLGIVWGDGWLYQRQKAIKNYSWRIGIVEDDKPLIQHFVNLTDKVFQIRPKLNDRVTKTEAYFNSKIVYELLTNVYGFPDGYKIGRLRIPNQILDSTELMASFLTGIFSTDGKFVVYKKYPRIGVDSATLIFIEDIKNAIIGELGV